MTIRIRSCGGLYSAVAGKSPVALWRLYLLCAGHLLIAGGMHGQSETWS
jgi:hypothetical protein